MAPRAFLRDTDLRGIHSLADTPSSRKGQTMTRSALPTLRLAILAVAACTALAAPAQEGDRSDDVKPLGNCEGCVFADRDFSDRKLMGIDLAATQLSAISFARSGLGVAIFDNATLTDVSFDGATLRGASFVGADLTGVTFVGADLSGAVFEGAILEGTDLQPAVLCNTQMPDDEFDNSDCN